MKLCNKCKKEKLESEFYKSKIFKDGFTLWCKNCNSENNRKNSIKRKFGLSIEEYEEMLVAQGGGCAICGTSPEENGKALAVDHDHSCCPGDITCGKCKRGLLCGKCNHGLGLFNDNIALLRKSITYLNGVKA